MSQRSKKKAIENPSYGSSEELYQALFEQAADGIFIADEQEGYVEVNQHGCEMLGYTREEIWNLSLQDLIPAKDLTRDPLQLDDLRAGKTLRKERYLRCKDGRLLPVEISAQMLTDGRFLGIVRDITERKQADEALQKSHEELRVFFSQTIDGCFFMMLDEPVRWDETTDKEKVLDYAFAHQHITKINDAMLAQYNATREQMLNLTPSDFFQHDLTHGRDLWRQLFDTGKVRLESDERKRDGTPMWIEGEYILLYDSEGLIIGHFGIQRDITERKQLEEELWHGHEVALQFSKQLAVLQEVTIQLSQAESADDLCRQAVQLARLRLGFDRVGIWFIEEHRGIMRGSFGTDERGELRDERNAQVEFRHEGLAWRVFSHKESTALVEYRLLRDHLGQEVGEGDNAMAALWDGDEVIGVISVDNLITRQPIRERQLEILRLYATTLGHLITRKWAGGQLRESNKRFRLLAESSLTGIYLIQDGLFRYVNPALAHVFGYKVEEVADKLGPMDLVYLDDRPLVAENIRRRVEAEEEAIRYDFRGLRKDGSVIYVEVHGRRIEYGGKTGVIGTLVDITERKQAEAERQSHLWFLESMDRINQAMQGTNDIEQMMINVLDTMLSILECDRAWLVYPCDPEAATWQVAMERTRPEYPGVIPVGIELPLEPVEATVFQILRATNGPVKFGPEVEHQVPVEMAQGFSVQSFIAMALYPKVEQPWSFGLHQCSYPHVWTPEEERLFQEIGRRLADGLTSLLAYRNLRQSERRLAEAQRMAHVGWWDRDYEADSIALSDEACRIFGLSLGKQHRHDLAQWHERWQELIHPEDRPGAAQAAEEALQGGPRYDVEYRIVRPNGEVRFIRSQGDVIWDDSGHLRRMFGTMQDITELRQAEDELRASEARFRTLVDHATDAFFLLDDQTNVLDVNQQACENLGYSREELIGMTVADFDADLASADVKQNQARLDSGELIAFDSRHRRKDGTVFPVEIRIRPFWEAERRFGVALVRDITERKQAEEALRASEARFRMLVEQAADAFFLGDERGRILDVNRQTCESLGYTRTELIGMTSENYDANPNPAFLEKVRVRLAAGEAITFDTVHRRKDGTMFPVEVRAHWFWQDGRRFGLALARDVTERKQAQEALTLFRTLIDHTNDVIEVIDPETGRFLDANEQACQALGYTREEFLNLTVPEINPLVAERSWQDTVVELRRSGFLVRESQHERKDGSIFPVEININYIRLDRDYVLAVVRDITERKRTEEALTLFRSLLDHANDTIELIDPETGRFLDVNEQACLTHGYTREEYLALTAPDISPLVTAQSWQKSMAELRQTGSRISENQHQRKDGSIFPVETNVNYVRLDRDYVLAVTRDITRRKEAEASLRQRESQLRHIIDTVPEGVILLDANGNIYLTNPIAEQYLVVLAPERADGRLTHLGDQPLNELLTSPPKGFWHEVTGENQVFEAIARPVENSSHNGGWVLVLRDVTEERDIQRRVQRQERLAAVGQLAAGIAHDFNNILAVIILYAQLILRTAEMPARAQEGLHTIEQQVKRATDLIQQVLDFSRQSVLERQPFDLLPFMEKLVTLLKRTLPEHIQIELNHDAGAYFIQADSSRMQQVIMNLAVNARDAMPEGGRLQIRLAHVQTEESKPMPVHDLPPGKWVQIEITDSGDGIPPEVLSNIFEPFFTTKAEGRGTGLGLAQVYGIVQQHEGYIDVVTEVGQGTTFFLYFPALITGENTADAPDRGVLQLGQGQGVLVVEDDPTIRKALQSSLAVLNYEALVAANGREALAILATKADKIELVLSDVVMPEMGGIALFHAIKEQYPTIPVVLLTGHPISKEMESLQKLGLAGWLPKPPDLTGLGNLLAKALTV
ncbi:MAG TPA: PAS domain S-box protein [Chloroflexota bacterium]|nr:PAS domain S-box protein [Chloroflexota bacterium]HUM67508.1 PAS domain S-box protein [Chloroflexota bacterium]